MYISSITAEPTCVPAGTRFQTADGAEVAVEDLQPGDRIRTVDGLTTVEWIGWQRIDPRLTHPARVNPIRIRAEALGGGVPLRDLYVSGDHAIGIESMLYNAAALVNGDSIRQVERMPDDGFVYYHVETERHERLLAEGVGVESFIDYVGSACFDNAPDGHRPGIAEMDLPRISAPRLVPAALKDRLAANPAAAA